MKYLFCFLYLWLAFLFVSPSNAYSKTSLFLNRIEGQVYDENRVPLPDINVELLNEVNSLLSRTKTNSAGRFTFVGVSSGHFQVKVLPLNRNLIGETQDVEVTPVRPGATDIVYVDFYLRFDKRNSDILSNRPAEVIFVQEVPFNSKKLYESGVAKLEKGQDIGLNDIEEAVKIFPKYFDALTRLGREYVFRQNLKKAYPYLLSAVDVNPRSYSNYYALSYSFYQLNEIPAALLAAKACITLDASSVNAQILYGTLLRINGNYENAEKTLLKAKSLEKKPNAEIHYQLALLYNKLNRNNEAIDELEAYLKVPDAPDKKAIKELIVKLKAAKKA